MPLPLTITPMAPGVWNLNEGHDAAIPGSTSGVDAYLVTGDRRAALVDTLASDQPLYDRVRELTALPLDVLVTHGHGDHAGRAVRGLHAAGCPVYLNHRDLPLLNFGHDPAWFRPVEPGQVFDLGGVTLEAVAVYGHTPGEMVFLDRGRHYLFTGDAIGAGVFWMQLPHCLPLRDLRASLARLWDTVKDMPDLRIFPGHRHQAPIAHDLGFLEDLITLTDRVIAGEVVGEDEEMDFAGRHIRCKRASYRYTTAYCYLPERV